jgi:hypothetical protein
VVPLDSKTLQFFYRNGLVHFATTTDSFTGMVTDIAKDLWERHLLTDDGCRFGVSFFTDETDIPGNIDFRRTGVSAGNAGRSAALSLRQFFFIPQGAGGAHFHASAAESAASIGEKGIGARPDVGFFALLHKRENFNSPQVMAGPHTPAAQDTSGRIMDKERVGGIGRKGFGSPSHPQFLSRPDILLHGLQLTVEILGADRALGRMTG